VSRTGLQALQGTHRDAFLVRKLGAQKKGGITQRPIRKSREGSV
jgi:hypothetical protein